MRKFSSILLVIGALLLFIGGYCFYSIKIFDAPKMTFSTAQHTAFSTYHDQCISVNDDKLPLTQKKFKLLVWNVHKGEDAGWKNVIQNYADVADFFFLQEVSTKQNLAQILYDKFPISLYVSAFSYLNNESGVNILSKKMPNIVCAKSEKEPWIIIPKVGSAMLFPLINGESLLLVNLHLVNFELQPTNYRAQLENIMQLVSKHKGPIILAGDFNTWNQGRLDLLNKLSYQHGLQEVDYEKDVRLRFMGNPLDHVFVRGVKVLQSTSFETTSSDHNPIVLDVELEN
ncbi:endonuclease/exonuclease/phosphatase family protein [Mannheimia massilioguelmaensis]|uniref:endonuclease/exonuclease/phosphatase family protein n=1 Tax=Mannheimia massilioguelmaensis TaxID=1604354 RepID=UPI0005C84C81|nr:endonuclease/exonuclease/phosphatase family protein [Mannheimia massilioguelmaensis]